VTSNGALQFDDITSLRLLLAPEQGAEIHAGIVADLTMVKEAGHTLFSSQYSFTLEDVASLMNEIALANPASRLLFDNSCYVDDESDKRCVDLATNGLQVDQWGIGNAPGENTEIIHDKLYCSPELGLVYTGSTNVTSSGMLEVNNALFITSKSMAAFFAAEIQKNLSWVQANPAPPKSPGSW
jgi:hypothetical protein